MDGRTWTRSDEILSLHLFIFDSISFPHFSPTFQEKCNAFEQKHLNFSFLKISFSVITSHSVVFAYQKVLLKSCCPAL